VAVPGFVLLAASCGAKPPSLRATFQDGRFRGSMAIAALVLAMAGCRSDSATRAALPETSTSVEASSPSSRPTPLDRVAEEARRVVLAWNQALDERNPDALQPLYGEHVRYYGRDLTGSAVVGAKRVALHADTTFHQRVVGEIVVIPGEDVATAGFLKRSGPAGDLRDVHARLVMQRSDGGALLIVEETDDVTEKAKLDSTPIECERAAARVVDDLPDVKQAVASAILAGEQSGGQAHYGRVGPIDDENDGFSVGVGLHTDQRFEAEVWYSVDRSGRLSVTVLGADVAIPPSSLRTVATACRQRHLAGPDPR
jgi:hypothetical protein